MPQGVLVQVQSRAPPFYGAQKVYLAAFGRQVQSRAPRSYERARKVDFGFAQVQSRAPEFNKN